MIGDGPTPEVTGVTPIAQDVQDVGLPRESLWQKNLPTGRRILTLLGTWGDIKKKDSFGIVDVGRANQECLAIIINKTATAEVEELERSLGSLANEADRQAKLRSLAYKIQLEDLGALGLGTSSVLKETIQYFQSLREEIVRKLESRTVTRSFVNGLVFPLRDTDKAIIATKIPAEKLRGTSLDSQLINKTLEEINRTETIPSASLQPE